MPQLWESSVAGMNPCPKPLSMYGVTESVLHASAFASMLWQITMCPLTSAVVDLQALVLASSVQMAHSALGNTPAIITPPLMSPATPNEPGATPMQVC